MKEGATLALQQLVEREQTWPLLLGPFATTSAMMSYIAEVNQAINTPGAVAYWETDGASQPTYYDMLSGELQIAYSYRKEQAGAHYTQAKLLTFSDPLGRPAAPRPLAAASAVGPVLMISPYASGGQYILGASTQAGVAGFGGQQQPSGGVFYSGNPSLAGDAPALLQIGYAGPSEAYAGTTAVPTPWTAVSVLPDQNYQPLIPLSYVTSYAAVGPSVYHSANAIGSTYWSTGTQGPSALSGAIKAPVLASQPPLSWAGPHRLFAIARASSVNMVGSAEISGLYDGTLVNASTVGSIPLGLGWQPVDVGTFALRASQTPPPQGVQWGVTASGCNVDLAGFVCLPDNATWFMAGGQAPFLTSIGWAGYNCLLLDDVAGDQFAYQGYNEAGAPAAATIAQNAIRMTQFSRGLVPRPDPKNGLPIIAIMGIGGQNASPGLMTNSINQRLSAQVTVLERTRYVLP